MVSPVLQLRYDNAMKRKPISADDVRGDPDTFVNFMRRLVRVPHSEIKAAMDAEKEMGRRSRASVSRVRRVPSKSAN
jgi:hypothetical protein